jgi:hypothetical protein
MSGVDRRSLRVAFHRTVEITAPFAAAARSCAAAIWTVTPESADLLARPSCFCRALHFRSLGLQLLNPLRCASSSVRVHDKNHLHEGLLVGGLNLYENLHIRIVLTDKFKAAMLLEADESRERCK